MINPGYGAPAPGQAFNTGAPVGFAPAGQLPRPVGPQPGFGAVPVGGVVRTGQVVDTYGLGGDPERRLNEASARQLARMVFLKYDDNDSGFMNSVEAANLITDLYASVNMEYRATPEEGKEFMKANDSDANWQFNRNDFEEFFVRHLSTQNNFSGFNLFGDMSRALPTTYKQPVHAPGAVGHFHRDDPQQFGAPQGVPLGGRPPVIGTSPLGPGFNQQPFNSQFGNPLPR